MKRLHVHVGVESLAASVCFYSALFGTEPTVLKADYAKWMLQDPRMNFAISQRGAAPGIEHLGIEVENHSELQEVYARLRRAARPVVEEGPPRAATPRARRAGSRTPRACSGRRS